MGARPWQLLVGTIAMCLLLLMREQPSVSGVSDPLDDVQPRRVLTQPAVAKLRQQQAEPASEPAAQSSKPMELPSIESEAAVVEPKASGAALSAMLRNGSSPATSGGSTPRGFFMALGVVSNVMWQNSFDRRRWIRETWLQHSNVGKTTEVKFIVAKLQSDLNPIPAQISRQLTQEQTEHNDLLVLDTVPERKSPCLKTMAWYTWATKHYPDAVFIAKTDDDAYVHVLKLELNMRRFASEPLIYIGSTLWGSFIKKTFAPCARRMGPMMCVGGMKEENCVAQGAVGPYPYAVGMLQVLSHKVASWMVAQDEFVEFERRATAATKPPMMEAGEDMVIGMFLYHSPWPLMPLHWGWDKLHDLCFKCERKDQIWRPITWQTVVAHHTANPEIMHTVHRNITRVCDDACVKKPLPFEVESLKDLCSRGSIRNVYSKCKMVGMPPR